MEMGVPLRSYTVDCESASLGSIVRAWGEGAPEMMAALPHSHGESVALLLLLDSGPAIGKTLWIAGTNADTLTRVVMLANASHRVWNSNMEIGRAHV